MPKSKVLNSKKQNRPSEDGSLLAGIFLYNFWEINPLSLKESWLDQDFWSVLGYACNKAIESVGSWFAIVHPEDIIVLENTYKEALNNTAHIPFSVTVRFYSFTKEIIWMELNGAVVKKEGEKDRIIGSAKNITEAKVKEQTLQYKANYSKDVIEGGNVAFWDYDFEKGLVEINKHYAELIGYTVGELCPLTNEVWRNLVHPEDHKIIDKTLERLVFERDNFELEYRLKHKKGHWVWVLSSGKISKTSKDNNPKTMSGIMYDITGRKQNEILLQDYSNIINRVNDVARIGLWEVTLLKNQKPADAIGVWDSNTRKYVGVSKDFIPNYINTISVVKEGNYRDMYVNAAASAIKNKVEFDITLPIIDQGNGREKWVRVIGIPEYTNEGLLRLYGFFQDLDKEINLARSLAIKEEEFSQTFNQATTGLGFIDLDNKLTKGNKSLFEIFKYTEEEAYSTPFKKIIHPEDYEKVMPLIHEVISGKTSFVKEELRGITKDGGQIWVQMTMSGVRNKSGKLIHMFNQMQDITDRKKNEILLQDYSNRIQRINKFGKIGYWEVSVVDATNINNTVGFWDDSVQKFIGVSNKVEPTLKNVLKVIKGEKYREQYMSSVQNSIENKLEYDVVLPFINQVSGEEKWARIIGIPEFKDDDCVRLYGFFQDVNEETRVSKELVVKEEELRHNFDQATVGMAFINLEGKPQRVNKAMSRITGYEDIEFYNIFSFGALAHPEDKEKAKQLFKKVVSGEVDSAQQEIRCIHKKGHTIWLSIIVSSIKNDNGDIINIFSQNQDITVKKNTDLKLADYSNLMSRINVVAKIGIWEYNLENKTVLWDNSIRELLGVSNNYYPTMEEELTFYKEGYSRDTVALALKNALERGWGYSILVEVFSKPQNKYIWTRKTGIVEFNDGVLTRLYGFCRDVDKETRVSKELAAKEELLRHNFNQSAIGMVLINLDGRPERINKEMSRITGYSIAELLDGISFGELAHSEDRERAQFLFGKILYGEIDSAQEEIRFIHKNGDIRWLSIVLSSVKNDVGEVTHLVSQNQDITDKKIADLKLADYSNLMSRINVAAKIGIWEIDLKTKAVNWDDTIKKMLGVPEEYNADFEKDISRFKEGKSRDTAKKLLQRAVDYGENFDALLEIKSIPRKKHIWVRTTGIVEFKEEECIRLYGFFQDVDEETRVSKELAVKEEELRHNFNQASVGMALLDLEGKPQRVNKAIPDIVGYSERELYAKISFGDLAHPEDRVKAKLLLQSVLKRKVDSAQDEIRLIHKDGHIVWLSIVISSVKGNDGEITHFLAQNQDITERKEANLKLADFSNLMSRINVAAKIGIWEIDLKTNTVNWDDTIKKMLGVSKDYLATIDEDISFFREGYSQETIRTLMNKAITNGENFDVLLEVKLKSKKKFIWTRTTGIVEFHNGKCNRLYGFFQDVDNETTTSRELAVKEEQLRHNFNQSAVGMAFVNLEGKLERVNKEMSRIVGFSKKELLSFYFGHIAHPEDLEKTQNVFNSVLNRRKQLANAEFRCIHKKGHVIWVSVVISAVKNDAGKLMHFLLQVSDISENKNLTENLKEHNSRLVNFAHIVSHNLRSHASNISMLLDLVFKDDPTILENQLLKNIKMVSDNMNNTIYDLNEIVELSSNISSKLTPQNLFDCINKSIQNINSDIVASKATLKIDVDRAIEVLAIHAYLESVILNLITNAVKYRNPSRQLKISITAKICWDEVVLSIEDNGLGIDLDQYGDKIFGLYKIFHEHKDAKGVGLFIVKSQVEAMGGKIEVASKVQKGTKFSIYFKKA